VIAVANQKGGVAKTTTTLSIAAALTERGLKVLAIDLDPQASLTFSLGLDPDELEPTLHDVLAGLVPLDKVIVAHEEMDLAPSNIDLAGTEVALLSRTGREYVLRSELDGVLGDYDMVLVDCPPSLGLLTLAGLTAAHRVVIPLQCETLSHRAVAQLLDTIADIRRLVNPDLEVAGLVATQFDARTRHSREVLADVQVRYGLGLIGVPVRKSVRFAEAPYAGRSILSYAPSVPGASAYRVIAAELAGLDVDEAVRAAAGVVPPSRGTT
jgi:chromosome partitioning protein